MPESVIKTDQKKLISAIGLGAIAILLLWWAFFGFGGSRKPGPKNLLAVPTSSPTPVPAKTPGAEDAADLTLAQLQPIAERWSLPSAQDPKRNIFTYYEPPKPSPSPAVIQTAAPTPTPPWLLASVSPSNVYARTSDFILEVTGDKFTLAARVLVDGRELSTRYISPQQLSASVPATLIASAGSRQVMVRSSDGTLYSNPAALSVTPPPSPNYNYVGIIGSPRYVDIAILQDKGSKEILNVQRGDIVGGRFRVTSISERELVLVDTSLKIRHSLTLSGEGDRSIGPQARPTPKPETEDDEP